MSTAPAVPATQSGSVFASTDSTVMPLSAIAAPAAPTLAEASPHAGTLNIIDPYFYSQFVGLTNFTWSTAQSPGTLLWSSAITPQRAHANLQYLAKMYNIWVGGLDYQIKVAGTGFHAGALAVVRLPPNIDPSSISSVSQFTMFEYVVIDPKTLDAMLKTSIDQRPIFYHYNSDDLSLPNSIGGYIAVYVLIELNTSSSGSSQIDVQVFNRASPDFNLLQIVPVTLPESKPIAPIFFETLFGSKGLHLSPYTLDPVEILTIEASSLLSSRQSAELVSLRTNSRLGSPPLPSNISGALYLKAASTSTVNLCDITGNLLTGYYYTMGQNSSTIGLAKAISPAGVPIYFADLQGDATGAMLLTLYNQAGGVVALTPGTIYAINSVVPRDSIAVTTAGYQFTPAVNESIVSFSTTSTFYRYQPTSLTATSSVKALTTSYISSRFLSKEFTMPIGQAVLAQVVDTEYNLPLFFIKLYGEGAFTARPTVSAVNYNFSDISIQFVGYIRETDPVPSSTFAMAQHNLHIQNKGIQKQLLERLEALTNNGIPELYTE